MSVVKLITQRLKATLRLVGLILLVTLPVWILSFTNGVLEAHHIIKMEQEHFQALDFNFQVSWNGRRPVHNKDSWWFDPDEEAGFPFYVFKINHPTSWVDDVGVVNMYDFGGDLFDYRTPDIRRVSDIKGLYRKREDGQEKEVWHHWLYLTKHELQIESFWIDRWDEAFDQLLRYHYANPMEGNASFNWLTCWNSYLCEAWMTRAPALVHFTTEIVDEQELKGREEVPGHDPVVLRVIELPLAGAHVPPGVFPSRFEQLRSITAYKAWQNHDPFGVGRQVSLRHYDNINYIADWRKDTLFARLMRAEDWVVDTLGLACTDFIRFFSVAGISLGTVCILGVKAAYWRALKWLDEYLLGDEEPPPLRTF